MVTGGEPVEVGLLDECRAKFGLTFNESYGQTEADFTIGQCESRWPVRPGSMGLPFPGHDVQVRTSVGDRAKAAEVGEVMVRTPDPTALLEYWRRPEATRDKFSGPWLRTGDLARVDEDGYFWFEARLDDMIKSAGYRIGPDEIEESLLRHPSVANTAVVGAPGDSPVPTQAGAVAQTAPGAEIRRMLAHGLGRAVRRVLAEVYTLTDAEVIAGLVVAHHRGADVRVVLDPNQSYNLHAFAVLRAGGVEVRWYPVPKGVLLHAKIGLFDAELVLGSANWTLSGLGVNHELDIETADAGAVQAYANRFESDWARSRA